MVMFGTIVLTGYLYYVIPKGFFPLQDTGMLFGMAEASQDISFPAMAERQQALMNIVLKDPAVQSVSDFMGPGGSTPTLNQGRGFVVLKPLDQRDVSATQVIERLRPQLAKIQGVNAVYAAGAGHHDRRPHCQDAVSVHAVRCRLAASSITGSQIFLDKLRSMPQVTDVATDQENAGPMLNVTANREVASSFGILPVDDRQHAG